MPRLTASTRQYTLDSTVVSYAAFGRHRLVLAYPRTIAESAASTATSRR